MGVAIFWEIAPCGPPVFGSNTVPLSQKMATFIIISVNTSYHTYFVPMSASI
jgi:hypothetical protein